ncbi:MAG TPA: hypothetical protein EYG98_08085 [Sulfurovum sp.]|nr:hypothetical protein [Sulfurovum sp.]
MSINIHPQYITDSNGEKISVIIPIEEFEIIMEDFQDLSIIEERKDEALTAHSDFMEELKQDGLL